MAPRVLPTWRPRAGSAIRLRPASRSTPNTSPLSVYNRIFGGTLPTGTSAAQILAQKESVITYMKGDLARLQTLVPASEKDRITAHTDAIAQLEASLQQMYGSTMQTSVCTKPTAPPTFSDTTTGNQGGGSVYSTHAAHGMRA